MVTPESYQPRHRAQTPADIRLKELDAMWDESRKRNQARFKLAEEAFCYDVEDGMDGYVIHTQACRLYGDSAISSTSACIGFRRSYRSHGEVVAVCAGRPKVKRERRFCECGHPGAGCVCF